MDFALNDDQLAIRTAVEDICAGFGDEYWLKKDREGGFPEDFYGAMAKNGWLGIAMPTEYGGAGLGILEAAIMMETVSTSGAGMTGASSIHMNVFGLHPVVVFGNDEQKKIGEAYIAQLDKAKAFPQPIVTQVVPLKAFYPAEAYHQDYAAHHPGDLYIAFNDAPKVAHLKQQFPELYAAK